MTSEFNSENQLTSKQALDMYRTIFENSFDAIFVLNNESRYIDANPSAFALLGYTRTELVNKKIGDLTPKKYIEDGKKKWKEFLKNRNQTGEYIIQRKDGKEINVEYHAFSNIAADLHLFFIKDITEKKKTEKNILKEREMWFSILDDLPAYVCIQDKNLDIVYSNKHLEENFGPIEGRKCHEIFYGNKDRSKEPCSSCDINKLFVDKNMATGEKTYVNGKTYFVYDYSYADTDDNEYVLGIGFDITERKSAENALEEREKTLQGIFSASPVGINLIQNREFIWSNDMMSHITGYSNEEMIGKNTRFLYPTDEDYEKAGYDYNSKLSIGKIAEVETKWKRKDGKVIDIHKKMSLLDPNDYSKGYITSVFDITKRKQIEGELNAAKKQLEDIIEFLPDATFVIDEDKKIIFWNHAMEEMTGVAKEEIVGTDHYYAAIPFYGTRRAHLIDLLFEDCSEIKSKYKFIKQKGNSLYAEVFTPSLYNNKGAHVWATASPLLDRKGNVVGAIEAIRDISEYKIVEEKIIESERTLESILTAAPVGIKLVQNRQITWCNDSMTQMTGYTFEELKNKNLKFLYPDEEEFVKVGQSLYEKWANEYYREVETVWKRKNGDLIYCYIRISPIDLNDYSKGMIEIITDITKSKKAEKQLEENLEYFAHLIDHIRNPLAILSGFVQVEVENENTKDRVQRQINRIEEIMKQLDTGWMDTEETRKFLRRYI